MADAATCNDVVEESRLRGTGHEKLYLDDSASDAGSWRSEGICACVELCYTCWPTAKGSLPCLPCRPRLGKTEAPLKQPWHGEISCQELSRRLSGVGLCVHNRLAVNDTARRCLRRCLMSPLQLSSSMNGTSRVCVCPASKGRRLLELSDLPSLQLIYAEIVSAD